MAIDSPKGEEPVALQWEFFIPPVLAIRPADITIGPAAESARKSLTCVSKPNKPVQRGTRYACILAGEQAPIGSGAIVVVQYRVQWDVKGAPIRVAIEKIVGASADLKRISMPNLDATIDIEYAK